MTRCYRLLLFVLPLGIAGLMALKYYRFTHNPVTEVDIMTAGLTPIKTMLPDTGTIGFASNSPKPVTVTTQYFQAQFVLAPVVINRACKDEVLLLADKRYPADTAGYTVLARGADSLMVYLLLKKNK